MDVDDSSQILLDLRRAVDSRLQVSDSQPKVMTGKRKRDDQSDQQMDTNGDVVMQDVSQVQVVQSQMAQKRVIFDHISSTVFNQRRNWLVGGLGPDDESEGSFQERVVESLVAELER